MKTGITAIALASSLLLCGCIKVTLEDKASKAAWPPFPKTDSPALEKVTGAELQPLTEETRGKLQRNDQALKNYAQKLDAQIQKYEELRQARD